MRIKHPYLLIVYLLALFLKSQSQVHVNVCITQSAPLVANAGDNVFVCSNGAVIGGTPTGIGGTLGYSYSWVPAVSLSSASISNPIASPANTTVYAVTVTDFFGCSAISSVSVFYNPLPGINAGLDDTIESGSSVQLNAAGVQNCVWNPSNGLSCTNCLNPVASPDATTSYYVTGSDENDCPSLDTVTVFVIRKDETLYIASSFSPNGDEVNDRFYVYGSAIKMIDIQIYNRWGELIFRTSDIKQGWDGKYRGKNVEGGVYSYSVDCVWLSGEEIFRTGIVTLLK